MIDKDRPNEPVLCSKCNKLFDSDSDYIDHFNGTHK